MTPEERAAVFQKVDAHARRAGYQYDAPQWLGSVVDRLYDKGELPEVRQAQERLHGHANALEDQFIQNAPMAQVNAHIRTTRPSGPGPNILPATPADSQRIDTAIEQRMLRAMKPKSQEEVELLSGAAERDFLANATTDEMKSYFGKKVPWRSAVGNARRRHKAVQENQRAGRDDCLAACGTSRIFDL
jgi:hypothetical protein